MEPTRPNRSVRIHDAINNFSTIFVMTLIGIMLIDWGWEFIYGVWGYPGDWEPLLTNSVFKRLFNYDVLYAVLVAWGVYVVTRKLLRIYVFPLDGPWLKAHATIDGSKTVNSEIE